MKLNYSILFLKMFLLMIVFNFVKIFCAFGEPEEMPNGLSRNLWANISSTTMLAIWVVITLSLIVFLSIAFTHVKRLNSKLQIEREESEKARKMVFDLCESLSVVVFQAWSNKGSEFGFSYFSPQLYQMFHIKPEFLIKDPRYWHQYLYKTDIVEVDRLLTKSMIELEEPVNLEVRVMLKNMEHWLSISISPMNTEGDKTYWSGYIEDVTKRKKAELDLKESEQRFELMAHNMQEVFWLQDATSGNMLYVSPAYEKIWGLPVDELYRSMEIFIKRIAREDRILIISQFRYQKSGQITYYEFRIQLPDGSHKWLANRAYPVIDERTGEVQYIVGVAVDISQQKALEDDLIQTMQDAETAYRAKSDFLSRMSHEIRTPMNAIIGMTQLARQAEDIEKIKNYLDHVEVSTKHLLRLMNDILDLSKIEAGKMQIVEETFDFFTTMKEALCVVYPQAEQKKQNFQSEIDEDIPAYLLGDALRLTQVIVNLLINAVKFTPESGSVFFRVKCIEREKQKVLVDFSIIDTGIGISKKNMDKLFEPFEQADGSVSRRFGGSGLGLAISQSLVQVMGGEIRVKSSPDRGSEFNFSLWFHTKEAKHEITDQIIESSKDNQYSIQKGLMHAAHNEKVYHKMLQGFIQSDLVNILKEQIEEDRIKEAIKTAQGLRSVANHLGIEEVARLSGLILSELSVGLSIHTRPLIKKLEEAMVSAQALIVKLLETANLQS